MAKNNAYNGVKTAYFSLELPPETLKLRIAREKVGVSKYQLQQKDYSLQQKTSIQKYYNELSNIPNFELLGYEQNPTIDDIEKAIVEQVEQGFELFIIDNLGKFATNSTENEAYSLITSRLQTLKNNHNICIVLIHHLNKPKNNEMTQLGGMSKIRGTQKIADNATLLVEVWRDQDPYSKDTTSTISQYKDTIGGTVASQSVQYDR
jgi:replicative DNA helicase